MACPQCHTLVHGLRLEQLVRDALALERRGSPQQARELWTCTLTLLPSDSKQAEWIRDHLRSIEPAIAEATAASGDGSGASESVQRPWIKRLGPLGPIAVLLLKSKGILLAFFKLKFLFSFFTFIALYVGLFGWRYGLGISVSLLIHELGHYFDIKRRGLPAEMPVFLPGLGAYVRWSGLGVTRSQVAQISLAGPLAGWIAAAGCFLLYAQTRDPLWAALTRTGAVLNTLNLIPVWVLDGGQAVKALGAVERAALLALTLALWLYSGEGIFFLVAAGATFSLFPKDKPQRSDWSTWLYFAAVLIALSVLLHATPDALANRN